MADFFIIHFNPLELYPPVQNEIRVSTAYTKEKIIVLSTTASEVRLPQFNSPATNISIRRLAKFGMARGAFSRYLNFIKFYLGSFFLLLRHRPARILYYETLSSFPVFLYKNFFNKKAEVFIHYHEYTSMQEHTSGTKLLQYFHRYEKKMYPVARWVSHTNENRMMMFEKDIAPVRIANKYILPNYPPASWQSAPKTGSNLPVKCVYVGALSLQTMYVKEFAEWVVQMNGKIIWDIYTQNADPEAIYFLGKINSDYIHLHNGIAYTELPQVLNKYDMGIVLYKGHIPNYVFNAPNKLFEYYVCGLDVLIPEVMKGSLQYVTENTYPQIIAVNFEDLNSLELDAMLDKSKLSQLHKPYSCEKALEELNKEFFRIDGIS
ncbi:MAG: hypothetical protein JST81_09715 [Bacteroidetes bacterium]|nr:hypothetical protein [Bacteroidota bacterium]